MSNILLISAVFPPEPVVSASLSEDLAKELSKVHHVEVLCPQPTRPHEFVFDSNYTSAEYEIHRLNSYTCAESSFFGRLHESYSFGRYCAKYILNHQKEFDCIYLNVWPIFAPFLIVRAALKCHIPCIYHVQDLYPESLFSKLPKGEKAICSLLLSIDKYVMRKSAAVVVISDKIKQTVINSRKVDSDKVAVVLNWQNEVPFLRFSKIEIRHEMGYVKPFTFMYLGNNGPLAGVELLIESFFEAKIENSKLIIAGSGSRKSVCEDLTKLLNASNVEFISVPDGKVPEIQSLADVMLLPVKRNGAMSSIPSKLPAYMFSSKPVLGSLDLESDTARTILESECGIVVEPENIDELKNAMILMANTDRKELSDMGKKGFEYALIHFSRYTNLKKFSRLIASFAK